jgi:hypothetical protein
MTNDPYPLGMKYGVSIDLRPPTGSPSLDPLEGKAAVSLFDGELRPIGIFESAGGDIRLVSHAVAARPDGLRVLLVAEAPSLDLAEAGTRQLVVDLMRQIEALATWQVSHCEVGSDERFAEAGLRVAGGSDLPPSDPAERARWHADQRERRARTPAAFEGDGDWRAVVMGQARLVRAFGPEAFGGDGADESTRLLAGALVEAATLTIDLLFEDIMELGKGTVAGGDSFLVLGELPERFADQYNGLFARKFLVALVAITGRLAAEQWSPPASTAEALALHVVIEQARCLLVDHEVVDQKEARDLYAEFEEAAFDDTDHQLLYGAMAVTSDGAVVFTIGAPIDWFLQVSDAAVGVHPFTIDSDLSEDDEDSSPCS